MQIIVIGGTRFIGPAVVWKLHDMGHCVTVFHRGKTEADLPPGVHPIKGARKNLYRFKDAFRKIAPDVVLDMISITAEHAETLVGIFRDVVQRIVAISSQDVYRAYGVLIGVESGPLEPTPLSEEASLRQELYPYRGETRRELDDPRRYLDDYDKIPIEEIVLGSRDLPGTVLRLPMVYGPRDYQHRLYPYIKRMVDGRPAIFLDEGLAQWRWTQGYVTNVAAGIALAVTDGRAAGRIYNLGEPVAVQTSEWVRRISVQMGWQGEIISLPRDQLPEHLLPNMNTDQHLVVDSTRIRRELGYSEVVSLDTALERTCEWECQNPPENLDPNDFDYKAEDVLWRKFV